MAAGSTDVEALTRGFRARLALLGVVVVGALGAAIWTGTRDRGIGEPEDRRRVLVVSETETNYYAVIERGGFVVEVDSLADWEAAARAQRPDSEATGLGLVVELADARGFGFVVVESPASLDLSGLELEPAPETIEDWDARDYAAISVGDLAFPHRLTVDEPGEDPFVRLPGYGSLQALFAQPAVTAREDDERPTVEELQYEDEIEVGRWMVERPGTFAAAVGFAEHSIAAVLDADPDTTTLLPPLATGSAVPTPNGGALVVHHALDAYSEDARSLDLHPGPVMRFDYLGADALAGLDDLDGGAEVELVPCTSLAGGAIEMDRRPRLEAAVDGSALGIGSPAGEVAIWHMLPGPGCEWREVAIVPAPARGRFGVVAPRSEDPSAMLLAQIGEAEGDAAVRVWIGAGAGTGVSERELLQQLHLLQLPGASLGALAFVDARHLAVLARTPLPPRERTTRIVADHAIHVLDRARPGAHLRVPTELIAFAEGRALDELAVIRPAVTRDGPSPEPSPEGEAFAAGPSFALVSVDAEGRAELMTVTIGAAAWQRFLDAEPDDGEAVGLVTLTPDDLDVRRLDVAGVSSLAAGPGGALAFAVSDRGLPTQLEVFGPGTQRRVATQNEWVDTLPRFFADGRHLAFVTMVRSSLSAVPYSTARIVRLERRPNE